MSDFLLTRLGFDFDAGHRLLNHCGKCASPHGHRYRVELTVRGSDLDKVGVVVDFSVLKARLKPWIDEHWDHTMILEKGDPLIPAMYGNLKTGKPPIGGQQRVSGEYGIGVATSIEGCAAGKSARPCYILPYAPTAENMARYLYDEVLPALFKDELGLEEECTCDGDGNKCTCATRRNPMFTIEQVVLWETPNCSVTYPAPRRPRWYSAVSEEKHPPAVEMPTYPGSAQRWAEEAARLHFEVTAHFEVIRSFRGRLAGYALVEHRYQQPALLRVLKAEDGEKPQWEDPRLAEDFQLSRWEVLTTQGVRTLVACGTLPETTLSIIGL